MSQSYPTPGGHYLDWVSLDPPISGMLYESSDVRSYSYHLFASIGTGHLDIEASIDSVHWHPLAVTLVDDTTPNRSSLVVPAGNAGFYQGIFPFFRVSGLSGALAVGLHGWD